MAKYLMIMFSDNTANPVGEIAVPDEVAAKMAEGNNLVLTPVISHKDRRDVNQILQLLMDPIKKD